MELALYNSYVKFFNVYFNAGANGIEVKPFDYSLTHWVTNQGDDIVVKIVRDSNFKVAVKDVRKLKIVRHTLPCAVAYKKSDFGLQYGDPVYPSRQITDERDHQDVIEKNIPIGVRKINDIIYEGMKLNRARVVATFFVPNEDNLPFVAVVDGDVNNLKASNLYWTDRNLYPVLNIAYEADELNHDVVIHTPAIRVLKENLSLYGWDKVYTRFNIPIPNDILAVFQQWKISIQSAVFTSLRFISQWSFCVYAIEYGHEKKVFVSYAPALDGIYVDQIFKVASQVPWLNDLLFKEGHGVLKLRYLTLSQTRLEAHDSCIRFMNEYNNKDWTVMNSDFYHPDMERQLTIPLKQKDLELINKKLMDEKGIDLETYLNAVVRKLKK